MKDNDRFKKIMVGTDFDSIEDAIAADLVSALPIVGAVTDFFRLLDSETRPQKALQAIDMITSPLPLVDFITPTNTLLYLDKRGFLPVKLEKIEDMMKFGKMPLLKRK